MKVTVDIEMERVSDEWIDMFVDVDKYGTIMRGVFAEKVIWCMKELQARRRTEKEHKNIEANVESVKPLPVKRCKIDGVEQDVKEWTVKQWFQKINEELDEFKREILVWNGFGSVPTINSVSKQKIREEAIDTITAITSMLEAMGIDEEQRNEAQRRVNEKNRKRGRL